MIAKLLPAAYDCEGTRVGHPPRRQGFEPTFPMAAYFTQPLTVHCTSLDQIRRFLAWCRYVSDRRQHGTRDYWTPPEEFERTRQGDCDCFALWTWRQLAEMGWEARYVVGSAGPAGCSHAWVTFRRSGDWYLLEPAAAGVGMALPTLAALSYTPGVSAAWDGEPVRFYQHEPRHYRPGAWETIRLLAGSGAFWAWVWARYARRILRMVGRRCVGRRIPPAWCGPGAPLLDEPPRPTARRALRRWWRHVWGR